MFVMHNEVVSSTLHARVRIKGAAIAVTDESYKGCLSISHEKACLTDQEKQALVMLMKGRKQRFR